MNIKEFKDRFPTELALIEDANFRMNMAIGHVLKVVDTYEQTNKRLVDENKRLNEQLLETAKRLSDVNKNRHDLAKTIRDGKKKRTV